MTTSVTDRFYVEGSRHPRPPASRVIYAVGAGARNVRPGADIELSHWVPNQTAPEFKADTSTEICLRYAASPARDALDLVVNDHADVDGFLALYALLESDTALANYDTLLGAGTRPDDVGDCYAEAMKIVTGVLDGSRPEAPAVAAGWDAIERGCERIDRGDVRVESITERLVSFAYPADLKLDAALKI